MTVVAIHQPNFLPWLGYFYKMYRSDRFVLHDNVEFSKRELTKRTLVRKAKLSSETAYLIVPLQKHSDFVLIKDLKIDNKPAWFDQHIRFLSTVYAKAPFLDDTLELLLPYYKNTLSNDSFTDFTGSLITGIGELFGCRCEIHRSSELPATGRKGEYNKELIQYFKGDIYFSGQGAKKYQVEEELSAAGIQTIYNPFHAFIEKRMYEQHQGPFINGLSVLDALINIGAEKIKGLFAEASRETL